MKIKKRLILISGLLVIAFVCMFNKGIHIKYLAASVWYGAENSINSKIIFSKKAGFYEQDFNLYLFAPSKEIYYTLDGSEPNKKSFKYENPIQVTDASLNDNIYSMRTDVCGSFLTEDSMYRVPEELVDKCTIIKAVYYDEKGKKSDVEEQCYFVGYDEKPGYDNVNVISITTEPDNLFGEQEGIYVLGNSFKEYIKDHDLSERSYYRWSANYLNRGKDWERKAYIQVFDTEKTFVLGQTVGIRIQGGVSRGLLPKSLNLYARDEYGDNRMQYDFFDTGFYPKRVTLSGGGNDYYGKMLDRLGAELTEKCDFCTMHYKPYVLFLNGEYWGFYYLTEKYDEQYIEQYYDVSKENVVIVKNGILEVGKEDDEELYEQMKNFITYADMTEKENYEYACQLLDIDSLIDYFAAEIYMARQLDWPSSNYALWRSREVGEKDYEDGKWRWMLFDVNTAAFTDDLIDHDTLAYAIQENKMFGNLCNSEQFRIAFSERILELADTIFAKAYVWKKIEDYQILMADPMEKHMMRFFGTSNASFFFKVESMKLFAEERKEYVDQMLNINWGL